MVKAKANARHGDKSEKLLLSTKLIFFYVLLICLFTFHIGAF